VHKREKKKMGSGAPLLPSSEGTNLRTAGGGKELDWKLVPDKKVDSTMKTYIGGLRKVGGGGGGA